LKDNPTRNYTRVELTNNLDTKFNFESLVG